MTPPAHWTSRTWVHLIIAAVVLALMVALAIPGPNSPGEQAYQMKAASNARQIAGLLHAYAADNNGHYPDTLHPEITTANQALRHLFIEELTKDERIFGCPLSIHQDAGNIGTAPDYKEALLSGENHWALVTGMQPGASPNQPLILEDPSDPAWPPRWNTDHTGKPLPGRPWGVPGRSWGKRTIIIARNDGTVTLEKLAPGPGLQPIAPDIITTSRISDSGLLPIPALDLTQSRRILDVEN